jgi:hypothetical protein
MEQRPRVFREYLFYICLALQVLCLSSAFILIGKWIGLVCALGLCGLWIYMRNKQVAWEPHLLFLSSLALAAAAIITGALPALPIIGSGFSLMVWDLFLLNNDLPDPPQKVPARRYESRHLWSLSLAAASGILIALVGRQVSINPPFVLLAALILLAMFGLDRLWSLLEKTK